MRRMRWVHLVVIVAGLAGVIGCHREEKELPPLPTRLIGIADKFFDVQALDAERAVVVGYGGKILLTADSGYTWTQAASGTDGALYRVRFVDANNGWVSGQDGLLLHSADGGKTWKRQVSNTNVYLFSLDFVDSNHGWAVGDKSIFLETVDGGANWTLRKLVIEGEKNDHPEEALASQDPVLYDVKFVDATTGWITGEFGKLFHTTDGGKSWRGEEQSLLGADIIDPLDIPTFFGASFLNAQEGVVVGLEGKIARTRDSGASWKFDKLKVDYPVLDPLFSPSIFADGTGWVTGAAGEVLRVDTPGGEWQRQKLGMEVVTWLRGMHWLDHDTGWIVGGYGLILHTKDGGKTWIPSLA